MQNDIHVVALAQVQGEAERREAIRAHYQKQAATGAVGPKCRSALLRSQSLGQAAVHGVFGGQGSHAGYFEELRTAYKTYGPLVEDFVEPLARALVELSLDGRARAQFAAPHGLDVLAWLRHEDRTPPAEYLDAAPVSFPLVGLLQLVQLAAVLVGLGCGPEDLPSLFGGGGGFTARSQGVVAAVAAAEAADWPGFQEAALKAVTVLFWTGVRCQQAFVDAPLPDGKAAQLERAGFGAPSPMLAISGLPRNKFERAISEINAFLAEDARMAVSVVNSACDDFVVSGPRRTLAALVDALEGVAGPALEGRRVRFLPTSVPCNSFLLADAVPMIEKDLRGVTVPSAALRVPVNQLVDGVDLRAASHNLVPTMVRLMASEPVDWSRAEFAGVTHAVDFGPGCAGGAGALVHRLSAGVGPRVLVAGRLEMPAGSELGAITELFDHVGPAFPRDDSQADAIHDKAGLLIQPQPCTETLAKSFRIASLTTQELASVLSSGDDSGWRKALFSSPTIERDGAVVPNPVLKLISSAAADTVDVLDDKLSFHRAGDLILYVSRGADDDITVMPFTWVTASNNLVSLAMRFEYRASTDDNTMPTMPTIREVTKDRDRRVYDMYRQLWLRDVADRAATEQGQPETNVFEAAVAVEQDRVDAFNRAVGNNTTTAGNTTASSNNVPVDFAMVAAWKPISQALLQDPVQGDLLSLAHLSSSYEAAPGAAPLTVGESLLARAYVSSMTVDAAGKTVEVACQLLRDGGGGGDVALTLRSRFLFRGGRHDASTAFSRAVDDRHEVLLATPGDQAVLLSQPWFRPAGFHDLDRASLEFRVCTLAQRGEHTTTGDVFLRPRHGGHLVHMATIFSHDVNTAANPVTAYLARAGRPLNRTAPDESQPTTTTTTTTTLSLVIPSPTTAQGPSTPSSPASSLNPHHSSPMFAALADLPSAMARGVTFAAAARRLVEQHVAATTSPGWVVRRFDVGFAASPAPPLLLPGHELTATLTTTTTTTTTNKASRTVRVSVAGVSSPTALLTAEAVVENPTAAFTPPPSELCTSPVPTAPPARNASRSPSFRRPRMPSFRRSFSRSSSSSPSSDHHHHHHHHHHDHHNHQVPLVSFAFNFDDDATPTRADRFRGSWDRWMGRAEAAAPGFAMARAPASVIRV